MPFRQRFELFRAEPTLGTFLPRLADIRGEGPLVEEDGDDGLSLTYASGARLVRRLAAGIATRTSPGDRVVIATPNGYGIFLLSLAVCAAGGIAVPVNPQMTPDEVDHVVADSAASLLVRDLRDVEGDDELQPAAADPDDVAAIFYTSGTTGRPKGAQLTHRGLLAPARAGAFLPLERAGVSSVTGMPIAHIAGFSVLVQMAGLGIRTYLLRRFRPDTALDAIETRRPALFVGVPAMYRMMLDAGAERRDLRCVRVWASGADVMPFELARRFQRLGATVTLPLVGPVGEAAFVDGYGMVELAGGVAVKFLPPGLRLPLQGLVGIPLPGNKLKIVDDAGAAVRRGEVGELAVKGPGVMKGYHGREDATLETLTSDGWLRTGDLARRGRLGLVEFAGRKKDVIKHGGYSVFAVEVEEVLGQHPAVAEAAVVGLADERKGEVPAAVVRLRDDHAVEPDELVRWAAERLSEYKVPKHLRVVADFPRTGTQKIQKGELRSLFRDS